MDNTIKIINFEMKVKSLIAMVATVDIVLILVLSYTGRETLADVLISISSSFIGICGGYYVSKIIDIENQKNKAVRLKNEMLNLIKNEIHENGIIFDEDYDKEKTKDGLLYLEDKSKFKVEVWEKLKFKIFTEGIEILDQCGFMELCELYKRFERINLQKELNAPINNTSKKNILNYIYNYLTNNCAI